MSKFIKLYLSFFLILNIILMIIKIESNTGNFSIYKFIFYKLGIIKLFLNEYIYVI
jgi:hypothetical protein